MNQIRWLARSAMALGVVLCATMAPAFADKPVHVAGESAPGYSKDWSDLDLRSADGTDAFITQLRLPPIAPGRLDAVRAYNSQAGIKALQVGVDRDYSDESTLDPQPALKWMPAANGGRTARFAVSSPGAAALRIGIDALELPVGAELRFVGDGQSRSVVDPVTPKQLANQLANGVYWTPVTEGERQTVEVYLPANTAPAQVRFSIISLAHFLASPYGDLKGLKIGESDVCEIDANCVSNPTTAYNNAKNAVARMSYQKNGTSFVCTGTLLNDTVAGTFIPYFFSANHCIDNQTVANTLTTFWFMESTSCGSGVASARVQISGGAALLFNDAATDALLLRLNSNAPSGAWFTGWNSAAVSAGTNITVLHHPAGDVKKVTLGQITGFGTYNGAGSFIRAGYTNGTTEGGSSGSGILTLINGEYILRGGLFGGSASCANTGNVTTPANSDAFSRFDVVYPSLQQFLAPGTTPPPPTSQQLQNGVAVTALSGAQGAALTYTIVIPSGATNLVVRTSGGSGDPDLYVRFGSPPTTTVADCSSEAVGPIDQCTFAAPQAGTYHVLISGFTAFSGLSLTATWQVATGGGVDEPQIASFTLPLPNPAFANCPAGYFTAVIEDGPGAGLSPGIFGLALFLDAPGTQRLDGGLNFGGLVDGSQEAFAGFNFINPANEQQRLDLTITGNPASSRSASLPVRIRLIRQPSAGVNETVLDFTATLSQATPLLRSINLTPAFYVVAIGPTGAASVPGGAADGEVYVQASTQFVNRVGGGFFGGVNVGGYHAAHPFGGVSGFAGFCLGTQHNSTMRVYSAPFFGATGARDLRLKLLDYLSRPVLQLP